MDIGLNGSIPNHIVPMLPLQPYSEGENNSPWVVVVHRTHIIFIVLLHPILEISLIETTGRVNPQLTPRVFCHLAISEPMEDCFKFPVIEIYNSNVINSLITP